MNTDNQARIETLKKVAADLGGDFIRIPYRPISNFFDEKIELSGFNIRIGRTRNNLTSLIATIGKPYSGFSRNSPEIGVNLSRSHTALLNDIKRRLLPKAATWLAATKQRFNEHSQEEAAHAELLHAFLIANRCGTPQTTQNGSVIGKGMTFANNYQQTDHQGNFVGKIRVKSLRAFEMIAAICADDYEFHSGGGSDAP